MPTSLLPLKNPAAPDANPAPVSGTTASNTTPVTVREVQALVQHTTKNPDMLVQLGWQMAPGLGVGIGVAFLLIVGRRWLIKWLESLPPLTTVTPLKLPGVEGIASNAAPPPLTWRQRWRRRLHFLHLLVLPVLRGTRPWFILAMVLSSALEVLPLSKLILALIGHITAVITFLQLGIWLTMIMEALGRRHIYRHPHDGARATTVATMITIGSVLAWALMLVLILQNLGFNVQTLVAGLGIGGVAIAFASQNLLQNVLASLTMVFDSPFALGDLITTKETTGVIEKIGLRNSTIRSLQGEQVILANNDLLNGRIANYGRMRARRVELNFALFYDTSPDEAEKVPGLIETVVTKVKNTRFDHCHIAGIGADRIEVQGAYFIESPDYRVYKDAQEKIVIGIMRTLSEHGISLAFPAKIVHPLPFDYTPAQPAGTAAPVRPMREDAKAGMSISSDQKTAPEKTV